MNDRENLGDPRCGSMIDIVIMVRPRLGVNHRMATGIFGSHPASDERQMAQCQVTASCPVERMQSTAENPA